MNPERSTRRTQKENAARRRTRNPEPGTRNPLQEASMADGYDRFENEGGGGGSFVMGLLTGTVLGAGLGMLFAPKSGSELRNQISEQAGNLRNTAGGWAEKGREAYSQAAERGRDMVDRAREAV